MLFTMTTVTRHGENSMFAKIEKRYQTAEVRAALAEDGIFTDRERIAGVSDRLGLGERKLQANGQSKRTWSDSDVLVLQSVFTIATRLKISYDAAVELVVGGEKLLDERLVVVREAIRISTPLLMATAA
jgi:hypothetical protein